MHRSLVLKFALGGLIACAVAIFAFAEPAADLPIVLPSPTVTVPAPTLSPNSVIAPTPRVEPTLTPRATPTQVVQVYSSLDLLSDYLTNRTYPLIGEGKQWIVSSLNVAQWQDQFGGTTFWDFWGDAETWETTNHQWQDDDGKWRLFKQESRKLDGRDVPVYVLVERQGPGVMDQLWFTHETIIFRGDILNHLKILGPKGLEDIVEWGDLHKLGNLRIEIDDRVVYDGAIRNWFSGAAQHLTPDLAKIFVWRYGQFGAFGNVIPIPYQSRIKVSVYGGSAKPKWFMATGVSLPRGTRVKPYSNDLPLYEMTRFAPNVLAPENVINQFASPRVELTAQANAPAVIRFEGAGAVQAIQFAIPKRYDPKQLALRVKYGDDIGIDLPFIAFFSDHDYVVPHRSTPIGVIDSGDAYTFYSNLPMPYQRGITIEIATKSAMPIAFSARVATTSVIASREAAKQSPSLNTGIASSRDPSTLPLRGSAQDAPLAMTEPVNTQLRAHYKSNERLQPFTPDYQVKIPGDGKLVGIVLVTKDQDFKRVPTRNLPGTNQEDPATHSWPNGYLEANLSLMDGAGNARIFNGHEDWAGGGYYFNLGFTTPSGGGNRPFGGILRYKEAVDGYATVFRYFNDLSAFRFKKGLTLSFGHGTWRNNYPVTFGTTVLYYSVQ